MLCDVVKSKSNFTKLITKLIHVFVACIFLISKTDLVKEIFYFSSFDRTVRIRLLETYWKPPRVVVSYEYTVEDQIFRQTQEVPYLNIQSNSHFLELKEFLPKTLTSAYIQAAKPSIAAISKIFPFKKLITSTLQILGYVLTVAFIKNYFIPYIISINKRRSP